MPENDDALAQFLQWSKGAIDDYDAKLHPRAKQQAEKVEYETTPGPEPEFNICRVCRLSGNCRHDIAGIEFGLEVYEDGNKSVLECPGFSDTNAPLPDELCWVCGKPNCENYTTVTRLQYTRADASYLLWLPKCLITGSRLQALAEVKVSQCHIEMPIHEACNDTGEGNE